MPRIDYRPELEKLNPEEHEKYVGEWRTYLQGLPKPAYMQKLATLTRQFGTEFASEVVQPELVTEKVEAPLIAELPAKEIEPTVPWYLKPIQWASEQPIFKPIFKGLEWYNQNWLTPAAMTLAYAWNPKIQEELKGKSPWSVSGEERTRIWDESGLPWLARTGLELVVDPLSYFGWGLGTKAVTTAEKAGLGFLAKAIKPFATAEEAYIRAAALPIRGAGKLLKKVPAIVPVPEQSWIDVILRGGKVTLRKPLEEAPRSVARNLPMHTANALVNLQEAGTIPSINKPFSQILEDIRLGIPDRTLLGAITNPKQQQLIDGLFRHREVLGLDEIIRFADTNSGMATSMLGQRLIRAMAPELGLPAPKLITGAIATFERSSQRLYTFWKKSVLMTPFYVTQNLVENIIRPIFVGVNPFSSLDDLLRLPSLGKMPMEMQSLMAAIAQDLKKPIPKTISKFALTPDLGGMTEAVIGGLGRGKLYIPIRGAAFLDRADAARTFWQGRQRIVRTLMETGSPEMKATLAELDTLWDDAIRANSPAAAGTIIPAKTGEPYSTIVYRGTKPGVAPVDEGLYGKGTHFTTSKDYAATYGEVATHKVNLKNPYVIETQAEADAFWNATTRPAREQAILAGKSVKEADEAAAQAARKYLEDMGHDGLVARNIVGRGDEVVVFHPKEATEIPVEQKLLEHLKEVSNGSMEDFIAEMNRIQRTKHLAIAKAMTNEEMALPEIIRQRISKGVPTAWAKNDVRAINKLFDEARTMAPQYIEEYQRLQLVQKLRSYRDLLRTQLPPKYRPYLTRILNRFKYGKASEAEARIAAAKTISEYERALFESHVAARRELEVLAEWNIFTEMVAKNAPPESLAAWMTVGDNINSAAFAAGDKLTTRTFEVANIVRFAKDPTKITQAWDSYIMEIQSLAPDLAEAMRKATPDNDLLWHTYRKVQDQRWFNVGQDKLRAAQEITGVSISPIPKSVDATGKIITQEDYMQSQIKAIDSWQLRAEQAFERRMDKATPKDKLLDSLREQTIKIKEGVALQELQLQNQASDMALDLVYSTLGNYAQRTNLDEFMTGLGVPFWFFPSRSIPFYTTQMIQHPRLGAEVLNLQRSVSESEQPARLFGTINIPGTNYWYNPLQSSMLWQLANQQNFTPAAIGGLEQGMDWMRNNLSVSLGPQWRIAATLVERVMAKQAGTTPITGEPQPLIPQQRWLEAIGHKKLPVVSAIATFLNEPFDMYLRAVYGDNVAEWSKREVEKTIVDMGYNPQDAPKEIIEKAWDRYYTRQLLSIPGGAVKEMTPTELARFEAINEKAKEMGLTKEQRVTLRELGESPFTGLRQDQMEALYKDIPAQKLWRYIRPYGLTAKSRPIWEDYIQLKLGREALLYGADIDNPTEGSRLYNEQKFDKALRAGKISPREWKSLYRQNYQEYINKVEQLEADCELAPKTDQDWEAYRELLGWDEPVRHPDDIKLEEYYDTMESSKFENDLGEFDYDAYRKVEQQFFAGLSQSTIDYIKARKNRFKTPLRAAYSRDMEKVQPYYDLQDFILSQYPPEIGAIIEQALASPDPVIQRSLLISNRVALVAMRKIRIAKDRFRYENPEIDRILRYWSS